MFTKNVDHSRKSVMSWMKPIVLVVGLVVPSALGGNITMATNRAQVIESTGSLSMTNLPMDAPSGIVSVKLERVNSKNADDPEGSFYVGHIALGQPAQSLTVMFHTSSGHVVVPHIACEGKSCKEHKRYTPWDSISAMDVQLNGQPVSAGHRFATGDVKREAVVLDYTDSERGDGEAKSLIVRDHICLDAAGVGDRGCVDLEILAATVLPDTPFRDMPNDGIVGLGLEGLSANPLCSFFARYIEGSKNMLPQFGFSYAAKDGEIIFGGQDSSLFISPLRWLMVEQPEEGFWQVSIKSVRVGSTIVDNCENGCHGIVDTGASLMGVRDSSVEALTKALGKNIVMSQDEEGANTCGGPELIFDMGDFTLALPPDEYTNSECVPQLGPIHLDPSQYDGVYALGAPLLRHYYAAFDWDSKLVGFARSTKAPAPKSPSRLRNRRV